MKTRIDVPGVGWQATQVLAMKYKEVPPMSLDTTLTALDNTVPECGATGYVDMAAGMVLVKVRLACRPQRTRCEPHCAGCLEVI